MEINELGNSNLFEGDQVLVAFCEGREKIDYRVAKFDERRGLLIFEDGLDLPFDWPTIHTIFVLPLSITASGPPYDSTYSPPRGGVGGWRL